MPDRHGAPGLVVHEAPAVQLTQVPEPLHTWLVPQVVPADTFVGLSTQVCAPVLQEVTPCLHRFGFVEQLAPATQPMQAPEPLHTWFVPQTVPPGSLPAASMHVCAPVLQEVTPSLQKVGFVVHEEPAVHDTQLPLLLHTWLVPQLVPADFWLPSMHVWLPVLHEVMPLKQAELGLVVQLAPAVQPMHPPEPLHTWLEPQLVPAGFGLPSTHCWLPVLQEVMPFAHAALGLVVQDCPAVQATQLPAALHTWLVPQLVPAALGLPSMHTEVPVLHEVMPLKQAELGLVLQAWFAVHDTQLPEPLHTWLLPQLVPAVLLPESTHVWLPVLQEVVPVRQMPGLLVQAWPEVHATQPPEPLHTWLVPQLVPAGSFPVASMHTCAPELHDVVPSLQVVGLVVHDWPAVHETQLPEPLHTWLVPQLVPAALFPESAQTWLPEVHVVWPVRQVLGLVVQLRPAVHETHAPLPSQTWLVPQLVPADLLAPSTQVVVPVLQLVVPCLQAVGFAVQF
jgi:hypothetical protein